MMTKKWKVGAASAALALMCATGCGRKDLPELAPVDGTVTLDGQPLPGVLVSFYPKEGGRPGTGETDEEGYYELTYVYGEEGTKLGPNRVEVTTIWPDGEPGEGEEDKVPAQYQGMESTLSFDVKESDNTFPIELKSSP